MTQRLLAGVLTLAAVVWAQRHVDPRNTYFRVIAAVPIAGAGTATDPKRPLYVPWPASQGSNGILGFVWEPADDGKSAIVEFVAQNRAALAAILGDKSIQAFIKGNTPKATIENAIRLVRKDFSLDTFGMVMP